LSARFREIYNETVAGAVIFQGSRWLIGIEGELAEFGIINLAEKSVNFISNSLFIFLHSPDEQQPILLG
jgi:hypothetical protein